MRISAQDTNDVENALRASAYARSRGGKVVALHMPIPSRARFSFKTGFVLDALPDWHDLFSLPLHDRRQALNDPEVRNTLAAGVARAEGPLIEMSNWSDRVIVETFSTGTEKYRNRRVSEIAESEQKAPFDALLDIVCADNLETKFARPVSEPSYADWAVMATAWRHGGAMIGGSDAGAHLDFTAYFDYPVYVIEKAVREHGVVRLEEAVQLMTDVPAQLYGLRSRGRVELNYFADIVIFDEARMASGPLVTKFDLPTGAGRLYTEPVGIEHVIVNGVPIVSRGETLHEMAGAILRSGLDSYTPRL